MTIHSFWVLCPLVEEGDEFSVSESGEHVTCENCIAQLELEAIAQEAVASDTEAT